MDPLLLSETIEYLRAELERSIKPGTGKDVRFTVGSVSIDLEVEITKLAEGEAGVKFYVLSAGGKAKESDRSTQRLHIELIPTNADGDPLQVSTTVTRRPS